MGSRPLFSTLFYEGLLDDEALLDTVEQACRALAEEDQAGKDWSKVAVFDGYRGYTSYGSVDHLPSHAPCFAELAARIEPHLDQFCEDCGFDLGERRLTLKNMWVNMLTSGGTHGSHLHPRNAVSGTLYLSVPSGSAPLKLEDPRIAMMMAAPKRRRDVPETLRPVVTVKPRKGSIFLWESWLRHEVPPSFSSTERISISFNYR